MGFFVRRDEKSGRCREVAVSGRSTVFILKNILRTRYIKIGTDHRFIDTYWLTHFMWTSSCPPCCHAGVSL